MRKLIFWVSIVFVVVVMVWFVVSTFYFIASADNDIFMFSNINECEKLCSLGYEGEEITRYETPKKDKNINNLNYVEYFGAKYESNEVEFEIFAYVFEDTENAKEYFENATGIEGDFETNHSGSAGIGPYTLVVIHKQMVYTIITPKKYIDKTEDLISRAFTVSLTGQTGK